MKVTQHGKNLWQITRLTAFNSFLVREDDGLTVVDTNMSGSGKDILQAAASIGLPIARRGRGGVVPSSSRLSRAVPLRWGRWRTRWWCSSRTM